MKLDPKLSQLKNKHPHLLKDIDHLECGEGWIDLLERLCIIIELEYCRMPEEIRHGIFATQIKEKFGGLRFYMNQSTPFIDGLIAMAESMSHSICERCGNPGATRGGNWVRTLCDKHDKQREALKKKMNQK